MNKFLAFAALAVSILFCQTASAATNYNGRLAPGTILYPGDTLSSGDYFLTLQATDGNFVVYRRSDNRAIWSAGSDGKGAALAIIQADGNLVVYTSAWVPVWSSGSGGHANGAYQLILLNNAEMEIYIEGQPIIWRTGPDNVPKGCPAGQKMELYPVCIRGLSQTVPACSVADAAQYAHSFGGSYGICH